MVTNDIQDGDRNEAPPANPALDPVHLAMLISNIVVQKLKNFVECSNVFSGR